MSGSGSVRIQTEEPFSLEDILNDFEQEDDWYRITFDADGYIDQFSAPAEFPDKNLKAFYAEQDGGPDQYTLYRILSSDHPVTFTYPAEEPPAYAVAVSTMDAPLGSATEQTSELRAAREFAEYVRDYDRINPVQMADQYAALDAFSERSRDNADTAFYAIPYDLETDDLPDPVATLQNDAYR